MDSCSLVWLINGMRTNPTHQMDVRKFRYGKEPALPDALHKTFFFKYFTDVASLLLSSLGSLKLI